MSETTDEHRVQIFSDGGDYLKGTLTWGWQCFTCRVEEIGYVSATGAQHYADAHQAMP